MKTEMFCLHLAVKRPLLIASGFPLLNVGSLRYLQRIFHFNAEIPDCAFQLTVTQQQLNCA
jgi:hypothetical protein